MGSGAGNQPTSQKKDESLNPSESKPLADKATNSQQDEQAVSEKEDESQIDQYSGDWHPILKFFSYSHLPERLQDVSRKFYELANFVDATLPRCAESSVALRKLLEAKDAAVRASLEK